jgi:putative spermidine/putrescine transport system ATP-binding protein
VSAASDSSLLLPAAPATGAAPTRAASRAGALPISLTRVTKTYGAVRALDEVSVDIAAGEFMTLLGPSGSGKTTLLMAIAGFVRADHGSIRFGSTEVIDKPPHQRNLGIVFQSYALFPHMSVAENVAYPLKLRRVAKADRERRARDVLATVQLQGYGERRVDQLSGGQRQRVALARAIAFDPGILLMDEPLSALDKNLREMMQLELRRLHQRLGTTTVYVTHDQREALALSNRIAVMRNGRIEQVASPRELYEAPANRFVAGFVGQSHFLPIEADNGDMTIWGRRVRVARSTPARGPRWLVLRPEKLEIARAASPGEENVLEGCVKEIVYQGDLLVLYVDLPQGVEISVQRRASRQTIGELPARGETVALRFHPDDAIVVGD